MSAIHLRKVLISLGNDRIIRRNDIHKAAWIVDYFVRKPQFVANERRYKRLIALHVRGSSCKSTASLTPQSRAPSSASS
jgi:hypothetical protein